MSGECPMADPEHEADCVRRAAAGDPQAAAELIERTYPLVAKVVRAYLPRGAAPEDYEQEVYVRFLGRLSQYRADAPLAHWLSRLAVSVCIDGLRARGRRRELRWADLTEQEMELASTAADPASTVAPAEALAARELLDKLLECLAPEDQVILRMLDMEERSTAEVARLTNRSQAAVKVRAFRARRKLRKLLESSQA